MSEKQLPFCILGAGSWGTALAILLARNGNQTLLWGRDPKQMQLMTDERCNKRYLPENIFPESLIPTSDLQHSVSQCRDIMLVVPSHAFVETLIQIKPYLKNNARICWATKGLEPETGALLSTTVEREIGTNIPLAILSGPTFAKELADNLPTACTIASNKEEFLEDLISRFHNNLFRIYKSTDVTGVQLGGAVKNIIAVGAGMGDGLGFGANLRTALITRGLAEIVRLGRELQAEPQTLYGLSGLGDLILTSTDDQSRNRRFGLALGQGKTTQQAAKEIGQVVEAVRNTREVRDLAKRLNIEMPIVEAIYSILYENVEPQVAAMNLLTRELTDELW